MSRLRGRNGAPLDETERRLVILAKLYSKQHGQGAPWSWLRANADISLHEMQWRMKRLRNRQAVVFKDNVPYSTYATDKGLLAAMKPEREQEAQTA